MKNLLNAIDFITNNFRGNCIPAPIACDNNNNKELEKPNKRIEKREGRERTSKFCANAFGEKCMAFINEF